MKDVPFEFIYHHAKFGNFWTLEAIIFYLFKFECLKSFVKFSSNWKRPVNQPTH
jgi:hypothetical protein